MTREFFTPERKRWIAAFYPLGERLDVAIVIITFLPTNDTNYTNHTNQSEIFRVNSRLPRRS
jgi:hypothetical protein